MTFGEAESLIDSGVELGWRLRDVAEGHVGWVLFAKQSDTAPWLVMLNTELRKETQQAIRVCPYRVWIVEFDQQMLDDETYAMYPAYWSRDETQRFRTMEEAVTWLAVSGYELARIGSRGAIGAP